MTIERIKLLTEICTGWIGAFAIVAGGGFAVVQYLEKEKSDRVKSSLDFFERYNRAPIFGSRQKLDSAWFRNEARLDELLDTTPFNDSEYRNFILKVIKSEGLEQNIFQLIAFYDSLEVCIRASICDSEAALSFLHSDAQALFRLHYNFIMSVRKSRKDPTVGFDLEQFTRRK